MRTFEISRWLFTLADEHDAWAKGYDDGAWRAVAVPHDWSVEQEFSPEFSSGTGYLPGGIGWYRAHMQLGELGSFDGRRVRLVFHGVYKNAQVWVNGYHLGGRPSGYVQFSFDLTELLSYAADDELVISVRVDHTDISDSRWYNGAGITRRVDLEVHEPVHLAEPGTTITTLVADDAGAAVQLARVLVNDGATAVTVRVDDELRSAYGRVHTSTTEVELAPGASGDATVIVLVPEPELWSDVSPNLYTLSTRLTWEHDGHERAATYGELTGIRTFRFHPDTGFSINGEPRILKGVCLHEDAGTFGTAVPAEVWLRRLVALKDMGCNAVRMAHNPHGPELYALCDILGFFVIDEAFDEWENAKNKWWQGHNVYPPRHEGYAKDFPEWSERDLVAMIDAHRNHPSIIAWSIGNEIDYPNDPYASPLFDEMTGNNDAAKPAAERVYDPSRPDVRRLTTIANRLVDIVKRTDPTRPVTVAAAFPELSSRTGFLDRVDLVGYNYKEHLYEADHARFPDKPLIGSENSHRYQDWLHVTEKDYISGQFLWTGIDYLGETSGWPMYGSGAGLLTVAGLEKHEWHLRRSWWSDEPVAYLVTRPYDESGDRAPFWPRTVSRAWEPSSDEQVEVLCFSNGDDVRLLVGDEPLDLVRDEEFGYWCAVTTPTAAPLVLESLRNGEVIARDELYAGEPAVLIDAVAWQAPVDAARRCSDAGLPIGSVVQIECTLRDEHGRLSHDDLIITAEVVGGELLGLENGDLSDNTPYTARARRTLDGRLVVFVRTAGPATVRLSAQGLPAVEIECA